MIAACVEKLLLIANSSFNFVIYCLAGKGFRQQMCKLIFRRIAFVCRLAVSTVTSGEDQRPYGFVGDGGEQVNLVADAVIVVFKFLNYFISLPNGSLIIY